MKIWLLVLAASVTAAGTLSAEALKISGPSPKPWKNGETSRMMPVFAQRHIPEKKFPNLECYSLNVGDKRVSVREPLGPHTVSGRADIGIFYGKNMILSIAFAGDSQGFGYPYGGKDFSYSADPEKGIITYAKKYKLEGGKDAVFTYALEKQPDSRVLVTWDAGISQEEADALGKKISLNVWLSASDILKTPLFFGKTPFEPQPREVLMAEKQREVPDRITYKSVKSKNKFIGKELILDPDKLNVRITFGQEPVTNGITETLDIVRGTDQHRVFIRLSPGKKTIVKGSFIIDLGEAVQSGKDTPPPVGGIDFYKHDAMHVVQPCTRNRMPNPSFEQGLRYWMWMFGGAKYEPGKDAIRFSIDNTVSKFGKNSLKMVSGTSQSILSMPIPLTRGKTYTASFWAKSEKPNATFALCPMGITRDNGTKYTWKSPGESQFKFKLDTEWKRYSVTFTVDTGGHGLYMSCGGVVWVDGLQLEEGTTATDFVCPPTEGLLTTSNPDNHIFSGSPIDAKFRLIGENNVAGKVELTLENGFREVLFRKTFDYKNGDVIDLPFTEENTGKGVFVLKAKYMVNGMEKPYFDFYRFAVYQPTGKDLAIRPYLGCLWNYRVSRADDAFNYWTKWGFGGFGSGGNPIDAEDWLFAKHGVQRTAAILRYFREYSAELHRIIHSGSVTDEDLKKIETMAYEIVKKYPQFPLFGFSNETEGKSPHLRSGNYDEYAKQLEAFARGAKRANPDILLMPDNGTSGFNPMRGYACIEGYLKSTQGKVKWNSVAVHPYGSIDGTGGNYDCDKDTAYLLSLVDKYVGPDCKIRFTEGFHKTSLNVPEWNTVNGDRWGGSKPTYDFGNAEHLQACLSVRQYIMGLKYWPRLELWVEWVESLSLDQHFAPVEMPMAVNAMANLLPSPKFITEIHPNGSVRGYLFQQGNACVAAVWCTIDAVEDGLEQGPVLQVKFKGETPQLFDVFGNRRDLHVSNGTCVVQLTQAPIYLRSNDVQGLTDAMKKAVVSGVATDFKTRFKPTANGVSFQITNTADTERECKFSMQGKTQNFKLAGGVTGEYKVVDDKVVPGKLYDFQARYQLQGSNQPPVRRDWIMKYFIIPQVKGNPDWSRIPAIMVDNYFVTPRQADARNSQMQFKAAYDATHFYLRVDVKKPSGLVLKQKNFEDDDRVRERLLYRHDGCLEVYFDTAADGIGATIKGYNTDDYRYDLAPASIEAQTGRAQIWRQRDPDVNLAGGVGTFPSKKEVYEKIPAKFIRTKDGFAYEITFEQRFLEPIKMIPGEIAGFGLFLHDQTGADVTFSNVPGAHCDQRPAMWPVMIFGK